VNEVYANSRVSPFKSMPLVTKKQDEIYKDITSLRIGGRARQQEVKYLIGVRENGGTRGLADLLDVENGTEIENIMNKYTKPNAILQKLPYNIK